MDFHVDLNIFRGPLDLLCYLVRKQEVEIALTFLIEQHLGELDYVTKLRPINVFYRDDLDGVPVRNFMELAPAFDAVMK